MTQIERYLQITSPASTWWPLAYERYAGLCKKLALPAKDEGELKRATHPRLRPLTEVEVGDGITLSLDEPMADVTGLLGEGQAVPVVAGTDLVRRRYRRRGIDLLTTDRVLAIRLRGPESPVLRLRDAGLGGGAKLLRVGMTKPEARTDLGGPGLRFPRTGYPRCQLPFLPRIGVGRENSERQG